VTASVGGKVGEYGRDEEAGMGDGMGHGEEAKEEREGVA